MLPPLFAVVCTKSTFLGLVPWYQFLSFQDVGNGCEVQGFNLLGSHSSLLLVLLAITDDLIRLAALFAVILIVYAGVKYIMSQGSPDETGKALGTIKNAITGLVIALVAVPFVTYLGNQFNGTGTGNSNRVVGLNLGALPYVGDIAGGNIVGVLLSVVFAIAGALSLLFIVIGGYNYVMSNGEGSKVAKAKQTIIYALVGLAVTIVAQSIVSFIINQYSK